jgi:hypothetical protein
MKQKLWIVLALIVAGVAVLQMGAPFAASSEAAPSATTPRRADFDHLRTGFPLTGAHAQARCETCHTGGRFAGTPKQCADCHGAGRRVAATTKTPNHVPTNEPCELCHRSAVSWSVARFSHMTVAPGACAQCHNGNQAAGKSSNHVVTTASCDSCHRTMAWLPALAGGALPPNHRPIPAGVACTSCHMGGSFAFMHPNTATGCATCHNGSTATGKPGTVFHTQVNNSNTCEACHRSTASFTVATFSHAGVTPGQCANCHNGANPPAAGKSANHIQTTASCDSCHTTAAWIPASFSHASVAPGTCASCHNGSQATGKPAGHFVTTQSCDACHTTAAWTPVRTYTHVSPFYRPHNSGVICTDCHTGNSETATWTFATYKPDCAGCHAGRFKPDAHKKVDSPKILYTVSELKDCTGSCHLYTDSTFNTISRTRSGEHRSTDGGF